MFVAAMISLFVSTSPSANAAQKQTALVRKVAQATPTPAKATPTPVATPAQRVIQAPPTPASQMSPIQVQVEHVGGEALVDWPAQPFNAVVDLSFGALKVLLSGSLKNTAGSYLLNFRPMNIRPPGERIAFYHLLDRETTDFRLSHVKLDGKIEHGIYRIKVMAWASAKTRLDGIRSPWSFSLGLGSSLLSYSQTNSSFSSLNRTAVTIKIGTEYRIRGTPWALGATTFMNALSITPSTAANPLFRFLGLNLRGGRTIPALSEPWELGVFVGWYYLTMMTDGTFGFSNVMGPQIYPVIKRKFSNGSNGSAYVKFSPISRKLGFFGLSNYELASGINYLFPKRSRLQWGIGLDASMLTLTTTDTTNQTTNVKSKSFTLSATVAY